MIKTVIMGYRIKMYSRLNRLGQISQFIKITKEKNQQSAINFQWKGWKKWKRHAGQTAMLQVEIALILYSRTKGSSH